MTNDDLFPDKAVAYHPKTFEHIPFAPGSATSEAAAEAIKPVTGKLRKRVFEEIARRGQWGSTRQEVEINLQMSGDTVRPRFLELADKGLIEKAGMTRPTTSHRLAEVWRAAEAGILMPAQSGE